MKLRKLGFALVCLLSLSCFIYLNYGVEQTSISAIDSVEEMETNNSENTFFAPDLRVIKSFSKVLETVVHPISR